MLFRKVTEGTVVQVFNDVGQCVGQQFMAGSSEYETDEGMPINVSDMPCGGDEYYPFDMVQPEVNLDEAGQSALRQALE